MNIVLQILEFVAKIFPMIAKKTEAPTTMPAQPEKTPPATDPVKYRALLEEVVCRKGQPPTGYEAIVDNPNTPQDERETYCNFFVRDIAIAIFNWDGFRNLMANKMFDYMETHPETWKKLDGTFEYEINKQKALKYGPNYEGATQYANQGCLVVAAWKNPTGKHGHVCIVAPENTLIHSNKWGRAVSIAANVGNSNWYGKAISYAFTQEPNLYLFLGA